MHVNNQCITTLQDVRHVPESMFNLISWRPSGEGFNFSSESDLMKVFKDAHVKFRLNASTILTCFEIVGRLHLSLSSRSEVVGQSKTTIISISDVQFYPEDRLRLGDAGTQQESLDHYSCIGADSHKSCVDQENH